MLEIEAKTNHTDEPLYHWGDDFEYHGIIYFGRTVAFPHTRLKNPIETFVRDAIQREQYLTELMTRLEIDIDVWDKK